MGLKGTDAAFRYDRGAGAVVHDLRWPLFRPTTTRMKRRYQSWSLDGSNLEVLTVGDGHDELVATVRFETDPWGLLDVLEAGADGYTIEYAPSKAAGVWYPLKLVEPSGAALDLARDSSGRGRLGAHEIQIRVRRVDGGALSGVIS